MAQAAIESLLQKTIGLNPASIGSHSIKSAIQRRMAVCGVTDVSLYWQQLQTSAEELEELIEAVIVPETWFFRDREPFTFLSQYVVSEWFSKHPTGVLRVLSVPCSTGEEPYSIAIALLEAGLSVNHFHIDAVDISKKALIKARQGIYTRNSFRGNDLKFRDRYFQALGETYQLIPEIRTPVNFMQNNLLTSFFLPSQVPYDIIFCRNLLIYFDEAAKTHALKTFDRLLSPQGLLFVGHSETKPVLPPRFVSVRYPRAFAYCKNPENVLPLQPEINTATSSFALSSSGGAVESTEPKSPASFLKTAQKINQNPLQSSGSPADFLSRSASAQTIKVPLEKSPSSSLEPNKTQRTTEEHLLQNAYILADQGHLEAAANLCETYLRQNPANPSAYVLLGQVRQATGDEEAAEACFQKATYLDPNHYEALVHLALLKEYRGELASAALIRQRLQRLPKT